MRRLLVGVTLGVILGLVMLLAGGIAVNNTPTPKCPTCAVLTHPYGHCNEAVVGGYICP